MENDNEFDRALEIREKSFPEDVHRAFREVADQMELSKFMAQALFGSEPTPQQVIDLYDRVQQRLKGAAA